jgi:hypothetical protein
LHVRGRAAVTVGDDQPEQTRTAADVDALVGQLRQACLVLQQSLPREELRVDALNVWSKAPFQLLCVRESLFWRVEELARCACDSLERGDLAAAALLTRAVMETVALCWKMLDLLRQRDKKSAGELSDLLMRAVSGARNWDQMPKAYHVMDLVRGVEQRVPGFLASYESLSELAHPNGQGVFGLFGTIDKERYTAAFGRNAQKTFSVRGMIVEALLGALEIFTPAYNRMADELPKFLEQLPKIWPDSEGTP